MTRVGEMAFESFGVRQGLFRSQMALTGSA
jgi:hypothetical protein